MFIHGDKMKRHAVIGPDNVVENIVMWDCVSTWKPPENHFLVLVEDIACGVGWAYENGEFRRPPPPAPPEPETVTQPDTPTT